MFKKNTILVCCFLMMLFSGSLFIVNAIGDNSKQAFAANEIIVAPEADISFNIIADTTEFTYNWTLNGTQTDKGVNYTAISDLMSAINIDAAIYDVIELKFGEGDFVDISSSSRPTEIELAGKKSYIITGKLRSGHFMPGDGVPAVTTVQRLITVQSDAKLYITDDSEIEYTGTDKPLVYSYNNTVCPTYIIFNGGETIITGGKITAKNYSCTSLYNAKFAKGVVVSGGTFESELSSQILNSYSSAKITGGTFKTQYIFFESNDIFELSGGNFVYTSQINQYVDAVIFIKSGSATISDCTINIGKRTILSNNGTTTINNVTFISQAQALVNDGVLQINGGTFSSLNNNCISNYRFINIDGGTFESHFDNSSENSDNEVIFTNDDAKITNASINATGKNASGIGADSGFLEILNSEIVIEATDSSGCGIIANEDAIVKIQESDISVNSGSAIKILLGKVTISSGNLSSDEGNAVFMIGGSLIVDGNANLTAYSLPEYSINLNLLLGLDSSYNVSGAIFVFDSHDAIWQTAYTPIYEEFLDSGETEEAAKLLAEQAINDYLDGLGEQKISEITIHDAKIANTALDGKAINSTMKGTDIRFANIPVIVGIVFTYDPIIVDSTFSTAEKIDLEFGDISENSLAVYGTGNIDFFNLMNEGYVILPNNNLLLIRKVFIITVIANDAETTIECIEGSAIGEIAYSANSGFIIAGWYTSDTLSEESLIDTKTKIVTENISLYPKIEIAPFDPQISLSQENAAELKLEFEKFQGITYIYQWQEFTNSSWQDISKENNATLTTEKDGIYRCVVKAEAAGYLKSATSEQAILIFKSNSDIGGDSKTLNLIILIIAVILFILLLLIGLFYVYKRRMTKFTLVVQSSEKSISPVVQSIATANQETPIKGVVFRAETKTLEDSYEQLQGDAKARYDRVKQFILSLSQTRSAIQSTSEKFYVGNKTLANLEIKSKNTGITLKIYLVDDDLANYLSEQGLKTKSLIKKPVEIKLNDENAVILAENTLTVAHKRLAD